LPPQVEASEEGAAIKVVVVDDEPELTKLIVQWLNKRGHRAFGITGGADIVQWVVKQDCDAVILDVVLRDANGLSLIAPIRKASPKTRVIVMSGTNDSTLANRATEEGAASFLAKPIDLGSLAAALE